MEDIKNIVHILFFITIGVVAVLSYLQARRTLFSPIKTEIFKIQIDELKSVLEFFNKQTSTDFDADFDFKKIFEMNAFKMHSEYVKIFFNDELKPSEKILNQLKECSYGAMMSEKHIQEITIGSELVKQEEKEQELNPAMKLAKWKEYELPGVVFTKKYNDKMEELSKLAASPVLPKELTSYLYEFSSLMRSNVSCIGEVLTECSQELPNKYSTAEDNAKFEYSWMWNKYNPKRKDPNIIASKILSFINNHLKIDEIMK